VSVPGIFALLPGLLETNQNLKKSEMYQIIIPKKNIFYSSVLNVLM
jgi:hypothetical protein